MYHLTRISPDRRILRSLLHSCLCILASVSTIVAQDSSCAIEWSPIIQISSDSVLSNKPQIAASGDTINLVWYGFDTLGTVGHDGVQYARSTDGGLSFAPQRTLLPLENALSPAVIACSGNIVYVATLAFIDTFYGTVLLRSSDGGLNWQEPAFLLPETRPELIVAAESTVYIHFSSLRTRTFGLLASSDAGISWDTSTADMPRLNSLAIFAHRMHGIGSAAAEFGTEVGYFASFEPGRSWFGPEILSKDDTIPSLRPRLAASPRGDIFAVWTEKGRPIVRRSQNEGFSWRNEQPLAAETSAVFSEIAAGDHFVSVVWDNDFGGIRIQNSNSDGATFCPPDAPTAGSNAGEPAMTITGRHVHVAWSEDVNGNVEILYREGLLRENPNSITQPPSAFALHQNYPNPFNGSTHIRYDIPAPTHVQVVIFNLLGEVMTTLVDALQTPARYDLVFDSRDYPTGVYFFRIRTETFSETRKLLLVR